MDRICELKELLKNVVPVNENTKKPADNEIVMIDRRKNPLDPNLLSYCFDNVLGFDVRYRIYEKVNYIIEFDYKGTYGLENVGLGDEEITEFVERLREIKEIYRNRNAHGVH